MIKIFLKFVAMGLSFVSLNNYKTVAQVISDQSLPSPSIINVDGRTLVINGGTKAGTNLFHSFLEFSLLNGDTAYFNNSLDVQNIFSRVTGSLPSNINGLIQANGTASLFFLNPNGILFGPNAALNIGGSFIATTANQIKFADQTSFGATSNHQSAKMTISVPIGLDFLGDTNQGAISLTGGGHNLIFALDFNNITSALFSPILGAGQSLSGLRVAPNRTIALIGSNVVLDGGILTAFSGNIEIGSVKKGEVRINNIDSNLSFNYSSISDFDDVVLTNKALLDATGLGNGQVNVNGKNVTVSDAGVIVIVNLGGFSNNKVTINASDTLNFIGVTDLDNADITDFNGSNIQRGIKTLTLGTGNAADIFLSASNINLKNFNVITTTTLSSGLGDEINIKAGNSFIFNGENPINSGFLFSLIGTQMVSTPQNAAASKFGNITISAKKILIDSGASLSTQAFSSVESGDVNLNAAEELNVSGFTNFYDQSRLVPTPSSIATFSLVSGRGGDIFIQSPKIKLSNQGLISSNNFSFGRAGNIFINTNNLQLTDGGRITSAAEIPDPFFRNFFGLPELPQGDSGTIVINSKFLSLDNNSLIGVVNEGIGNAGDIQINAESLVIKNDSTILATAKFGQGGNIFLNTESFVQKNSNLEATVEIFGDGGNINVNSQKFLLLDRSNIQSNAFEGSGGNIKINSPVFFQGENSLITASSELGIEGTINIDTIPYNFDVTNVEIPTPISPTQVALKACYEYGQRLRQTGQGQLPRGINRAGRTFDDLIPMGQVVSMEKLPDGRVRLLSCQDVLKSKLTQD